MSQVKAKKSLGQHFLTNQAIAARIASTLDGQQGHRVIEVGPGMGVLTRHLLDSGHDLVAVELDGESIAYLKKHFPELEGRLVEADFLKLDLNELAGEGEFCVTGNYPYNISSQIMFKVLEYKDRVRCCTGMFQREVAQRLAAGPGSKTYGILSVLLQAWYDIEYLFTVDEHEFDPPPKVKSGVIRLTRNGVTDLGCDERLLKTVVKTSFGQRRKTLRNSLRPLLPPGADTSAAVFARRPEQLSVDEFIALTNRVAELRRQG